tara:strand:- start:1889 stop:3538 length:1650 start_codon:yes stop_codon:yes gene_type:complete
MAVIKKIIVLLLFLVAISCKEVSKNRNDTNLILSKPNIVVVLADDMRLDYLGAMSLNNIVETPNLDKLAAQGSLFNNAFVTSPICTPSRTTIFTGMYERKHGVTFGANAAMTEEAWAQTYPMLLKENGYYTGYIGKNHTPIGNNENGFGYESEVMEQSFDFWYAGHKHLTFYPKKQHKIFNGAKFDNQLDIIQEGIDNFIGADDALIKTKSFLKLRPKNNPFVLMVNFNVPHSSSTNTMKQKNNDPALYKSAFRDQIDQLPLPNNYIEKEAIISPKLPKRVYSGDYISSYDWVRTGARLKENQIRTLQTVKGIDDVVGKLIDELEAQGQFENTLILFTSDHGLFHGEFGLGGKTFLYDTTLRIPLIIKAPGKKVVQNETIDKLTITPDIAPTILDYAGIKIPNEMQGESIRPLLEGEKVDWRTDFFSENMFMGQNYPRMEGVRSANYKYIRYFSKDRDQHHVISLVASILGEKPIFEELFNLKNDPEESENLAENQRYLLVLEKFRRRSEELVLEAKGNHSFPNTHIKEVKRKVFRDSITAIYNKLVLK